MNRLRALAARTLAPVLQGKASLDWHGLPLPAELSSQDRALLRELVLGVCRHYFSLRGWCNQLLSKPLRAKDSDVLALLLIGLYQMEHLRVPDHAAIHETVGAALGLKKAWAKPLINAVLRGFQRQRDSLGAAGHEHPIWLAEALRQAWPTQAEAIFASNNALPPLTLRVNQRRGSREHYAQKLSDAGIAWQPSPFSPWGLRLTRGVDVSTLPGYVEGDFSVQDEAAQLAADLLALAPGQRVLDACCAPGGKTSHIAETQTELGGLVGVELEAQRMIRTEENLHRLGLNADLKVANVLNLSQWWDGQPFDRILVDAPCSATGVIRRHPDIKLLRRAEDIPALVALQREMLQSLWPCLKPGGRLVYATCSLLPAENEAQVAAFVETQSEAIHYAVDASWGEARPFGRQLFPQINGHDGFYYAVLEKRLS